MQRLCARKVAAEVDDRHIRCERLRRPDQKRTCALGRTTHSRSRLVHPHRDAAEALAPADHRTVEVRVRRDDRAQAAARCRPRPRRVVDERDAIEEHAAVGMLDEDRALPDAEGRLRRRRRGGRARARATRPRGRARARPSSSTAGPWSGRYWRSSSQTGQCAGGVAAAGYSTPQVAQNHRCCSIPHVRAARRSLDHATRIAFACCLFLASGVAQPQTTLQSISLGSRPNRRTTGRPTSRTGTASSRPTGSSPSRGRRRQLRGRPAADRDRVRHRRGHDDADRACRSRAARRSIARPKLRRWRAVLADLRRKA